MNWRGELRTCPQCLAAFQPLRQAQAYCKKSCRVGAAVTRHRHKSDYTAPEVSLPQEKRLQGHRPVPAASAWPSEQYYNGPTPRALQGDDYPIEMDADGDPILPAFLDRRPKSAMAEAA